MMMRRGQIDLTTIVTTLLLPLMLLNDTTWSFSPTGPCSSVRTSSAGGEEQTTPSCHRLRHLQSSCVVVAEADRDSSSIVLDDTTTEQNNNVQLFDGGRCCKQTPSQKAAWNSLVPMFPGNEPGVDVTIQWTSAHEGSIRLLRHLFPLPKEEKTTIQLLQPLIQESMETFASLLLEQYPEYDGSNRFFRARIVSTRGVSGTKCPRWHVDHVPMRWIQSLVGPGCDYVVGSEGIRWEIVNGLNMEETDEANMELVDETRASIRHGREGQGVLLWGAENDRGRFPAVHKSPALGPFQGRVLLTLDVIRD